MAGFSLEGILPGTRGRSGWSGPCVSPCVTAAPGGDHEEDAQVRCSRHQGRSLSSVLGHWGLGHSTEPSCPCLQPLTALLSLQKKDDKKVVNGKAAEQEDVPGVWAPRAASPSHALARAVAEPGSAMSSGREKHLGPIPKAEELPETETPSAGTPGGTKGLVGEGLQPR